MGDKYGMRQTGHTTNWRAYREGAVTRMAGCHPLMAASKGMTEGSSPAAGLPLGPGQGLEEGRAHPRRAAEPSAANWNAFSCCHRPIGSKNHRSLVHDFERL